jgi:hypothetical protein
MNPTRIVTSGGLGSTFTLPSHPRQCLKIEGVCSVILSQYAFFIFSCVLYAHLILLDFITLVIVREAHKLWSSSLWSLLHSPVPSSLLGQNILLMTLFSNIFSLCSFLSAIWVQLPVGAMTEFCSSPSCPHRFRGPPNLLSNRYRR